MKDVMTARSPWDPASLSLFELISLRLTCVVEVAQLLYPIGGLRGAGLDLTETEHVMKLRISGSQGSRVTFHGHAHGAVLVVTFDSLLNHLNPVAVWTLRLKRA
jgi:hypothetical protein